MGKRALFTVVAAGATVVLTLLVLLIGEAALRTVHLLRDGIPFFESAAGGRIGSITLDPVWGWRATDSYEEQLVEMTKRGNPYIVRRSQKQFGFRRFGNTASSKPKLLVIGDSFTQATAVSDDRTYHAILANRLDAEVFAYGAGGYGTLQEWLVLDRYLDVVQPDALLWQYCVNDFINNDNELERLSTINNNGWTRPYWRNGKIEMLSPKESAVQIREWANRNSRLAYFILSRVDRLRARTSKDTVETEIERVGASHPGFRRSVETTDRLMELVRQRMGKRPILAFSCMHFEPYSQAFAEISHRHDIEYWDDVGEVVQLADAKGEDVLASDNHWNERGHALVAEALLNHVRARGGLVTSY